MPETFRRLDRNLLLNAGYEVERNGFHTHVDAAIAVDKSFPQPSRTDFIIISFVTTGWLKIRINFIDHQVEKGQLAVMLPGHIFEVLDVSPDIKVTSILIDQKTFGEMGAYANSENYLTFFASEHRLLQLAEEEADALTDLMRVMEYKSRTPEPKASRKDITRHLLQALMLEVISLYHQNNVESNPAISRTTNLTMSFLKLLSTNFREQRSVQFYADQLFVTAKYLSSAVKKAGGKSPGAFIDEAVIAEAKILLADPFVSIADISDRLNFSNQSFFSKFFRRHTGHSPSEYRAHYWPQSEQ